MPLAPASMFFTKRSWPGTSTKPRLKSLDRARCAKPRSIEMPRRFSSASRSVSTPVSAPTSVVLPWSMWPAVPTMIFLIPVFVAFTIFAQEPEVTFRSTVAQVRVDAQVLDQRRPVSGLTKEDFVIYDEGVAQPLVYFGHEDEPVTVLLLLDVSGSMKRYVEQVSKTARQALGQLNSRDRAGVMAFSKGTQVFHAFSNRFAEAAREIEVAVLEAKMPEDNLPTQRLVARRAVKGSCQSCRRTRLGRRIRLPRDG